ncbi:unnamed protein product [Anisakis simplex]|uniref:PA14 domain-containing protein n=1 Tax=Anisakis simplex TaxID=6269 RepID=A0A0M3JWL7_ANISI|nr:unnamed protein product [Anisakis simplex]
MKYKSSAGRCTSQTANNAVCSFYSPNGYELSWSADPSGIVYFNYTQLDFPMTGNYWTGVSFGQPSVRLCPRTSKYNAQSTYAPQYTTTSTVTQEVAPNYVPVIPPSIPSTPYVVPVTPPSIPSTPYVVTDSTTSYPSTTSTSSTSNTTPVPNQYDQPSSTVTYNTDVSASSSYANQPLYDQPTNQYNSPVLTNSEQNQVNYQQILRDYQNNPNPTAGMSFTNNIYGYNYTNGSPANPVSSSATYTGTSSYFTPSKSVYSSSTQTNSNINYKSPNPVITTSGPYYYYSSVYPSYLVPGPYYYRVGPYLSSSNAVLSSNLGVTTSVNGKSSVASINSLGFNPLTGVYRDTPSSGSTTVYSGSSSNNGQVLRQSSTSSINAAFTPYFYSPFVQAYTGRQYDATSPIGTAYGPNAIPYQVLEPHSSSYYQTTLDNK